MSDATALWTRAPWFGPGPDEEGRLVPGVIEIASTDRLELRVEDVRVYEEGLAFRMALDRTHAWRPDPYDIKSWTHSFNRKLPRAGRLPQEFAPEILRVKVRYPDGREARSIDPGPWLLEPGERPEAPVLAILGGRNQPMHWDQGFWLWPKPEADVELLVEWRLAGVHPRPLTLPVA